MAKITQKDLAEITRTCKDPQAALKAVKILNGTLDPMKVPETAAWVDQCFHRPPTRELQMHALNVVLDGHGVEPIRVEGAHVDNYHYDIVASYVNMGDTYAGTIVLDHDSDEFLFTSWGDFLESWEAEHAEEMAGAE